MTKVLLPTVLRQHAQGVRSVEVAGETVGAALADLANQHPQLGQQLLDDQGELKNYINVFVGDENIRDRQGAQTPLDDRDEILIVPALAGG